MTRCVKFIGGWVAGKGAMGKIKGHSAKWLLSPCLHIFFWGTAQKWGVLRFCAKPTLYVGFRGALFGKIAPKGQKGRYLAGLLTQ